MSGRKYTDEEIVNALECCWKTEKCIDCPYYVETDGCIRESAVAALDLINRQKAEIEELEYDRKLIFDEGKTWQEKANALQVELDAMRGAAKSYKTHYENARAEAIREFAERLKEKSGCIVACRDGVELYTTKLYQIRATDIDNLVAEMTEGE